MTEHRTWAKRERRSRPSPPQQHNGVPDRVDPAMDRMERASLQPTLDCPPSHAHGKQLIPGNDPILPRRQLSNHSIQVTLSAVTWSTSPMFCPPEGLNTGLTAGEALR